MKIVGQPLGDFLAVAFSLGILEANSFSLLGRFLRLTGQLDVNPVGQAMFANHRVDDFTHFEQRLAHDRVRQVGRSRQEFPR